VIEWQQQGILTSRVISRPEGSQAAATASANVAQKFQGILCTGLAVAPMESPTRGCSRKRSTGRRSLLQDRYVGIT
jgi:hypothetical protein